MYKSNFFQSFPINQHGSDFVIGDVHGAFDAVTDAMKTVHFNPDVDRLFCVGDLIDRGADSALALEFLETPFVHSVLGNHEEAFIRMDNELIRQYGKEKRNGMAWASGLTDSFLEKLKDKLSELPYAIELQTNRGSVGIVHGDIPHGMGWDRFIERIENGDPQVLDTAIAGRYRFKFSDDSGVQGIDHVYVGHSIQWDGVRQLGNVWCIDTGAGFVDNPDYGMLGALSIINLSQEAECCTITNFEAKSRMILSSKQSTLRAVYDRKANDAIA